MAPVRPLSLALGLVVAASLVALVAADGQLPPAPPPPPPSVPAPNAVPPVAAPTAPVVVPADAPIAVLDRAEHDFGVAKQETELKTEFSLKNAGRSTLTLELRADCGCSAVVADTKTLEPGQSTPIRVLFRTFGYVGTLHKRIRVLTNDPVHPQLEAMLKVDVGAGVIIDPARFYFGTVETGSAPSLTIKVQWKDGTGSPFEITSTEIPGLDMAITTKKFDAPPWHGYEVTAGFKHPPAVGTVSGTAILRTNSPDAPRLTAAVTAFVSGKIWVDRREVSLGMLRQGKERTVSVGCRGLTPKVDLGVVTARSRGGRVKARAIRAQEEWLIEVEATGDLAPGRLDDVVEVTSSLVPEPAEIAVKGEILAAKD